MPHHVRKVAVLGSGVMGSAIAAHFANAGIAALVLDIVPPGGGNDRNAIAAKSLAALGKVRPAPLFTAARQAMIEAGNLEDDLPRLAEADWVIEAVKEEMEIKKRLLPEVAAHLSDHAILSSNTSGLSLNEMADSLPAEVRPRFLGTHFFNPPRYMELLELIPTRYTDDAVIQSVTEFGRNRLGKGIVMAKDTPNFISNRIGMHSLMTTLRVMEEMQLTVEEVDALTGPVMARPKTATFRLADLIGIDTMQLVAGNVYGLLPDDESRAVFIAPDYIKKMVDRGLTGRKAGAGFYRKVSKPKKAILTLDLETMDYRESRRPELPGLREAAARPDPRARVRALMEAGGRTTEAAWRMIGPGLSYAAMRMGEIADDADTIDRAVRWGFNWELGPFEVWDALGFRATTERLRGDGLPLPPWVDALYDSGATTIYREADEGRITPLARPGGLATVDTDPREMRLDILRDAGSEIVANRSASLLDLGDGVFALEFHSKMNAIDADTVDMMLTAVERAEREAQALVVANDGANFCAGANLEMLLQHATEGDWAAIERIVRGFQHANDLLERSAIPVATAPQGMALGGGCEIAMAGNAMRAAAEAYIGLVEVGAGVIPAGGGCLRLYRRLVDRLPDSQDLVPAVQGAFERIGMARVSTSAEEARDLGFLRPQDSWSMNRRHLASDARELALAMARTNFTPPTADTALPVMGRSGSAMIEAGLLNMHEGRFISDHDRKIGGELARILVGGDVGGPTTVSAQHILDLECEVFVRLCGEPKTRQRIQALLETGKPLRN